MRMSARAVGMAVLNFLFRRLAHRTNRHGEVEFCSSQRVVAVDRDDVFRDIHNRHH